MLCCDFVPQGIPGAKMRESGVNPEHCPVLYGRSEKLMAKAGH